jgi:peroxidase
MQTFFLLLLFNVFFFFYLNIFSAYLVITLALQDTISSDLRARARAALLLEKSSSSSSSQCDVEVNQSPCPPSKFRSPTGECNNVNHRDWGARGDIFMRMLAPNYADDKTLPRISSNASPLPAPDHIIQKLQKSVEKETQHPHITAMLPAWGQLLAYDLFQVVSPQSTYKCCEHKDTNPEDLIQCYVKNGEDCKEYMRSVPSREVQENCLFNYREQMNAASGFIDGSGLYGATEKEFQALRTFSGGKVDIRACARCNEAGAIGVLHSILLKEHNRVADELIKLNPDWSDATVFFESRRIITAEIQHITYNEFLPIVLGQQVITKDELR